MFYGYHTAHQQSYGSMASTPDISSMAVIVAPIVCVAPRSGNSVWIVSRRKWQKHSHESVHHSYLWLDSSQRKLVMRPALFYATAFWYKLILPTSPTSFSQTSFSTTLFVKSMAGVEDVSSCTCIYLSRFSSVVFCCVMRHMALHPSFR